MNASDVSELAVPIARCCACGVIKVVRNIVTLAHPSPRAGCGWGCVVCNLPNDGAIAIVCDDCINADAPLMLVCLGTIMQPERLPIRDLSTAPFIHHLEMHRDEFGEQLGQPRNVH